VARQKKLLRQKSSSKKHPAPLCPWGRTTALLQQASVFSGLEELHWNMANFARPVASSIRGIDFGVLTDEEIKAISVKRIHNTPTLDSFNNPVPGGLYDPALGAWGDHV